MSGSKQNLNDERELILAATRNPPPKGDYVWDGEDEEDRPLSREEMKAGIKRGVGRPKSPNPKVFTGIRLDPDILERFKAEGKGWQTRINAVLREWVDAHPV